MSRIPQSLNLKNPKAHALATELSRLTGESLTGGVIGALELRLEAERKKQITAGKILAFSERFSSGLPPGLHSSQHATQLFGDG